MKEFYPWSKEVYRQTTDAYVKGRFSVLDIQLSGKCNYNCVYCDSPDRTVNANTDFDYLESLICKEPEAYKWLFVCGLGEPLFDENKVALIKLLKLCKDRKMKCTIFTNGSNMDDTMLEYVKNGVLYPIIKIDTFSTQLSEELYGTPNAYKTLQATERLFEIAHKGEDRYCHVAASIVPTTKNIDEIYSIVDTCIKNNVFPLIGQLEYAGKAINSYEKLLLTKEQLLELKEQINLLIGKKYNVPICPSVIAGIHISTSGYVTVDKRTGLSCSWFWLETPDVINLCDIKSLSSLSEAEKFIINYRNEIFNNLQNLKTHIHEYPFGGCGGNVKDLFEDYLKIQSNIQN